MKGFVVACLLVAVAQGGLVRERRWSPVTALTNVGSPVVAGKVNAAQDLAEGAALLATGDVGGAFNKGVASGAHMLQGDAGSLQAAAKESASFAGLRPQEPDTKLPNVLLPEPDQQAVVYPVQISEPHPNPADLPQISPPGPSNLNLPQISQPNPADLPLPLFPGQL